MATVKNAKNNKRYCHDCHKEIIFDGKEIKNGLCLIYDNHGKKIEVFKCKECYEKDSSLNNYNKCEVYSRVVGYLRPVSQWHFGKQQEFKERKEYTA